MENYAQDNPGEEQCDGKQDLETEYGQKEQLTADLPHT